MENTIPSLFAAVVAKHPSLPLLTFYDDATGERTELSGATLDNWVSKTANLLVDGCGLGPGDIAAVRLPPHWQTAAVLLGAWSAGLAVRYGEPAADGADVEFASVTAAGTGGPISGPGPVDRYVLGLAPMGLPLRGDPPAGWADYIAEVRQYGDFFPGLPGRDSGDSGDLVERAAGRALELGIAGGRVLLDAVAHPDPADWLLAPLAAGASIVLTVNTDPAKLPSRAETEQAVLI